MVYIKMQHLFKVTLILLELAIIPWSIAENSTPYCYKNITEISYKNVTKTRLKSVSSKNFFKKIISKKDTQVEVYEDQEPVYTTKLERYCCEGYDVNEYELCEPQCIKKGCPQHSICVEPEVCECKSGYFSIRSAVDGQHYCEPICKEPCPELSECVGPNQCACTKGYFHTQRICKPFCASGCPYGGVCIEPNKCSCQPGYKAVQGSCIRINPDCALGDHICNCSAGFIWNNENSICEEDLMASTTYSTDTTEFSELTDSLMVVETDIETSKENIDPNQVFDENIETITHDDVTDEYGSTTNWPLEEIPKCPNAYVFYKGQCRPRKFVSNEIDCWLKPCLDKNAECLENGTCACKEGFKGFTTHIEDQNSLKPTILIDCLTEAEFEAKLKHLLEDPHQDDSQEPENWTLIFFIILGSSIIVAAFVYLGMKLFHRQTGEMDVEGKNLSCSYNKRACSETEKSSI